MTTTTHSHKHWTNKGGHVTHLRTDPVVLISSAPSLAKRAGEVA
jgi:hypothetical protein